MLRCRDVTKVFATAGGSVTAVDAISLEVHAGEIVAIMGPSGSGKSTLLQILGGLERPTAGSVQLDDQEFANLSEEALTVLRRRRIGYIFQAFNLVPGLTAAENVALTAYLDGRRPAAAAVDAALAEVGLSHRRQHRPAELSGGEQQRVAIARALLTGPSLLLADEPTASLDSTTGVAVLSLLRKTAAVGRAVVMVTHDHQAAAYADRILHLRDGRIVDAVDVPRSTGNVGARERLRQHLGAEVTP